MPSDCPEPGGDASLARARAVNRRCEQFEAAWRAGARPAIASYLEAAEPVERSALFRELLELEIELRREHGDCASAGEYAARYPDRAAVVTSVFSRLESELARGGES